MCWQEINQYMVLNVLLLVFHFILHIIYLFDLWLNKTYIYINLYLLGHPVSYKVERGVNG